MRNKIYYLIPLLQIITIIFGSNYFITETNDSYDYYKISNDLPFIKNSLFPIFYPFLLKVINLIFKDFFISSKFINCFCILFSLYIAKKYLKEWKIFWILTLTWGFRPIISYSWTEVLLIPFFLLFFINLKLLIYSYKPKNFICITLLFVLMVTTKYSLISIILGSIILSFFFYIQSKNKSYLLLLLSCFVSLIISFLYLSINKLLTGYFTGDRSALGDVTTNLRLSLYNTLQSFNPLFSNFTERTPYFIVLIIFALFLVIYYRRFKKIIFVGLGENIFFILLSFFYLLFLWITYFFTRIDVLSIRLLFPFYILFFVGLYINSVKINFYNVILFLIILNILFTIFNQIKSVTYIPNYF